MANDPSASASSAPHVAAVASSDSNAQAKAEAPLQPAPVPQPAPPLISQTIAPPDLQKKPSTSKKPREEQIAELKDFSKNFNLQEADAPKGHDAEKSALPPPPLPLATPEAGPPSEEKKENRESVPKDSKETKVVPESTEEKDGAAAPAEPKDASALASKSTLNPNAKEFTFNPLAKSFVPRPGPGQSASSQQSSSAAQVAISPSVPFPQSPVTPQGNGPIYPPQYVPPVVGNGAFPPAVPVSVAYQGGVMTYSPTQNNFANGNNPVNHGNNPRFSKPPQPVPGVFQSPRNSTSDSNGQQPNQEGSNGTMTVIPQGYPHPMAFAAGPGHGLTPSTTPGAFPPGYPQVYQVMGGAQRMIAPAMVAQHAGSTYLLQHPASGNGGPSNAHSGQSQVPGQAQAPTPVQQPSNNAQASSPPQESAQAGPNGASMVPPAAQVPNPQVGNQSAMNFNPQVFYQQQMQQQMLAHAHHFHQAQQQAAQAQNASGQPAAPTSQPQVVTPGTPGVALNAPVFSQSGQIMYQVPMMAAAYHHRFATAAANAGNPAIQLQPGKQPQPNSAGPQPSGGAQPVSTPTGQPPQQPPANVGQVPAQQPGVPGFVQYAAPMGMSQGYQIQHPPPSHPGATAASQAQPQQPHASTAGYPSMYQHYAIASVPPSAAGAPPMSTAFTQTSANNNLQPSSSQ